MVQEERLEERGLVLEALAERPGRFRVLLEAGPGCEECVAKMICKPEDGERRILEARSTFEGVHAGDQVLVQVDGSKVLWASSLMYGLPLLAFVVGLLLTWVLAAGPVRELVSFTGGALLAGATGFALRPWLHSREEDLLAVRITGRL